MTGTFDLRQDYAFVTGRGLETPQSAPQIMALELRSTDRKDKVMSPEEAQLLNQLFDRVRGASATPRDRDAETLIETALRDQPYAAYYLAQAVILQEKGLEAATARIHDLEAQLKALQEQAPTHDDKSQQGGFLSGLGSIFGGGNGNEAPPAQNGPWSSQGASVPHAGRGYEPNFGPAPQPQWAQQQPPTPMPFQQNPAPQRLGAGGGFLSGALNTAAGVAGGMLMADAVRSLFSPHIGGTGLFGGGMANGGMFGGSGFGGQPIQETIVNNTYIDNGNSGGTDGNLPDDNAQMADYDNNDGGYDDSFDGSGFDDSMNA
jgi:uncharacterized protein